MRLMILYLLSYKIKMVIFQELAQLVGGHIKCMEELVIVQ